MFTRATSVSTLGKDAIPPGASSPVLAAGRVTVFMTKKPLSRSRSRLASTMRFLVAWPGRDGATMTGHSALCTIDNIRLSAIPTASFETRFSVAKVAVDVGQTRLVSVQLSWPVGQHDPGI